MKKLLLLLFFFPSICLAEWSPPAARIPAGGDWSNAGIPGGIPTRVTICTTLSETGDSTDRTTAIQNALDGCGTDEVVYLNAGTYYTSGNISIPSNTVLRGAGMDQTIIYRTGTTRNVFGFGADLPWGTNNYTYDEWETLSSSVSKDDYSVTVSDSSGYDGQLVVIAQGDGANPEIISTATAHKLRASAEWPANDKGSLGQTNIVSSVDGNTINLVGPLYYDYSTTYTASIGRAAIMCEDAGLEDLTIQRAEATVGDTETNDSEGAGTIWFNRAIYSWVKNVKIDKVAGPGFAFHRSYGCVMHGCWATEAWNYYSGGAGYQVSLTNYATDCIIENNVLHQGTPNVHFSAGGTGSVFAYNYVDISVTNGGTDWAVYNVAGHRATPNMILFEGNNVSIMEHDMFWGNSIAFFHLRNHYDARQTIADFVGDLTPTSPAGYTPAQMAANNRTAIHINSAAFRWSIVGNTLGQSGDSYDGGQSQCTGAGTSSSQEAPNNDCCTGSGTGTCGYETEEHGEGPAIYRRDADVDEFTDSIIRHGNYDYYNNSVIWCTEADTEKIANCQGTGIDQDLPDSLYLASKPSWWDDQSASGKCRPWPPIGPDVSGYVMDIPAKDRYESETYSAISCSADIETGGFHFETGTNHFEAP
ncbi:MAG: hypothetical protein GY774_35405 [Planctomycetes bacterium]|nr:hypothetical protein [Planctomycetota bacterium]